MSFPTTRAAPAKLNLHLDVGPLRPDGFHPIRSIFVPLTLADELTVTQTGGDGVTIECDDPAVPTDGRNLITRAAEACNVGGLHVKLTKRIPAGGGLGGGSSDAAAMLRLLAAAGRVDLADLPRIAAGLGSDVPFFLQDAQCVVEGRGEVLTPLPAAVRPGHAVLALPGLSVLTGPVFAGYDRQPSPLGKEDLASWVALPSADLLSRLRNDLERPAFALHPPLADLRDRLEAAAGRPVRMSGSGSTLFTLADDADDAEAVAATWRRLVPVIVTRLPHVPAKK